MKRNELVCPNCGNRPLEDNKSHVSCNACNTHYQVSFSRKGVNQFLFICLPSLFFFVTIFVLDWKLEGFLEGVPQRNMIVAGSIVVGALIFILSIFKMSSEFEVGKQLTPEK